MKLLPQLAIHGASVSRDAAASSCYRSGQKPLLAALAGGETWAQGVLFDRHAGRVERVLLRVLGRDQEVADLAQDVFERAFRGASQFRGDEGELAAWLTQIAVFTARGAIRKRRARRWLGLLPTASGATDAAAPRQDPEAGMTVQRVFAVLDQLPAAERIPLSLRWLEQMELQEIASACQVSLATIKRRLRRGRKRFDAIAARDSLLSCYVGGEAS